MRSRSKAEYSSRLKTAGQVEDVYRRFTHPEHLSSNFKSNLKTFERLVLKQGLVLGLDELSGLKRKYRHLQRGDGQILQGEKHPLLTFQDVKAISPRVNQTIRRTNTLQKWSGTSRWTKESLEAKQWRENFQVQDSQLLNRWMKSAN